MTYEIALDLLVRLHRNCPVDTGQLRQSIHMVQLSANEWTITIGNNTAVQREIPSSEYASATNYRINRNYHWVNDTIVEWVNANKINIGYKMEDLNETN